MNICQIIPHYIPAYRFGGPQNVAHSLGTALGRLGHDVVVCTTNLADETNDLDVVLDKPVVLNGVRIFYEPTRVSRYWGFSPELWKRMSVEIPRSDIVFIHAHYQFANWSGAWLSRRYHKPYVIFAHGSLHTRGLGKNGWLKKLYLKLLEERNFNQSLFIAFNAPEELNQSLYRVKGKVIYSGIDPLEFQSMPSPGFFRSKYPELQGKRVLLFLGRLDVQQKGLDLLLPAFAKLAAQRSDVHLIIAGPDEANGRQLLLNLAQRLGIKSKLTFTGLIQGEEKRAALNDADIFVLPSRFEGLSIALLEALFMGLPVLATDQVGLCQEIAETRSGVIVEANEDSIVHGLVEILNPEVMRQLRGNGTKLILEKYTWHGIAKNLLRQVQAVLS